jgi:hypothetical protein
MLLSRAAAANGLLLWRKLDNWTAFTDGVRWWVNGPLGLQQRLNDQRFSWEANPHDWRLFHRRSRAISATPPAQKRSLPSRP